MADAVGNQPVIASTLWAEGAIARVEGRADDADRLHRDALQRFQAVGFGAGILDSLEALAGLAADRGDPTTTARLLGAAVAHRAVTRCARPVPRQDGYEADLARARAGLAADDFGRAWADGLRLSRDEAVALALGEGPGPPVVTVTKDEGRRPEGAGRES
jgi:hypothetical protein